MISEGERLLLKTMREDPNLRKEWLDCIEGWIIAGHSVKTKWQAVLDVMEREFPDKDKPDFGPTVP